MEQLIGNSEAQSSDSNSEDRDWINFIWYGSNKTRFQCQNSCNRLLYLRAIQEHTGGEMMSHRRWATSSYLTIWSVLQTWIRWARSRRSCQTVLLTPDPRCTEDEEYETQSSQNRMEALSTRFLLDSSWETRERHSVLANEIACNHHRQYGATCIERVITQHEEMTIQQRS